MPVTELTSYQRALTEPAHALAILHSWHDGEGYARELRDQANALLGQARAIEDRIESERDAVRQAMIDTGCLSLVIPDSVVDRTLSVEAGASHVELLSGVTLADVPARWVRVKRELDKAGLAKDVKAGDPEAVRFARMVVGESKLGVK